VGWYEQRIFNPFILDTALDVPKLHAERARLLATATGEVLEIGLGTGLNVPNYPAAIGELTTLAPEPEVHPYAARRARRRGLWIEHIPGDARRLPFAAGRFDTVVSTLVLCTVPEPVVVVRELARVLRPGGQLLFLEHVGAKTGARRVLQRLFKGLARFFLCGCDMTRDTERTLVEGGFSFQEIERYELSPMIWLHREAIRGIATAQPVRRLAGTAAEAGAAPKALGLANP